jgi:hypothetical protein
MPALGLLALLLTAGCGAPPEAMPTEAPLSETGGSLPPAGSFPAGRPTGGPTPPTIYTPPVATPPYTYPTLPRATATTRPPTTLPTLPTGPAPSHAPRCTGEPTGAQILAKAKTSAAVPDQNVTVTDGPYCAGGWSFTTLGMPEAEPLSVIAIGSGATLELVTVGTDVCNPTVKAQAPTGIRAMACGS